MIAACPAALPALPRPSTAVPVPARAPALRFPPSPSPSVLRFSGQLTDIPHPSLSFSPLLFHSLPSALLPPSLLAGRRRSVARGRVGRGRRNAFIFSGGAVLERICVRLVLLLFLLFLVLLLLFLFLLLRCDLPLALVRLCCSSGQLTVLHPPLSPFPLSFSIASSLRVRSGLAALCPTQVSQRFQFCRCVPM